MSNYPPSLQLKHLWPIADQLDAVQFRQRAVKFPEYESDPLGFCQKQFNEFYTPDIIKVMESVRDNVVTIAQSANAVGKTHAAARISTWWYKCHRGAQVYTAAAPPLKNLVSLLWGEIDGAYRKAPSLFADDTRNHLHIYRSGQEFITGVTIPRSATPQQIEAMFSGKHAPHLLFVLDEADAIPAPVYKGIESCLSGGNARLLCMYNPRDDKGILPNMTAEGARTIVLSAFNHPNVITGEEVIPGAVTRNKTLNRIWKWTIPIDDDIKSSTYGRFTPPDYLIGAIGIDESTNSPFPPLPPGERLIVNSDFGHMVLGTNVGGAEGRIYDVWMDDYKLRTQEGLPPLGNVTEAADYLPGAGPILWGVDDGYSAGSRFASGIDPLTGTYAADAHPRVFGLYQMRPNGQLCRFDELYRVKMTEEKQIAEVVDLGYPEPDYAAVDSSAAQLRGRLMSSGIAVRKATHQVDEGIKELRRWIAPDEAGFRRLLVHPRCRHFRAEMTSYAYGDKQKPVKSFDHGPDEARYLTWTLRYE